MKTNQSSPAHEQRSKDYRNRIVAMSYTQERSSVVACIDCILETEKEANYVK